MTEPIEPGAGSPHEPPSVASFKDDIIRERQALTPGGYWVVMRPLVGEPGWYVRVYNFATWKHRVARFADEATARGYFTQWLL